jgi:hypothetical protein
MRRVAVGLAAGRFARRAPRSEINPGHDPDGLLIRRFIEGFVDALQPIAAEAAGEQRQPQ